MKSPIAVFWLQQWGENVRDRCGGSLGMGIADGGRFRPSDDPHPASWVQAQVETVLNGLDYYAQSLAAEVYVGGKSIWSLRHEFGSHHKAREIHRRVVDAVQEAVVNMRERTIAEAHAKQLIEAGHFEGPGWTAVIESLKAKDGMTYRRDDAA